MTWGLTTGVNDRIQAEQRTREMRVKFGTPEARKMALREIELIASQHPVFTQIKVGSSNRTFSNPPGRVAKIIKAAEPTIIETGELMSLVKYLQGVWRYSIRKSRRLGIATTSLKITVNQLEAFKRLAVTP
jgi:hypothetical protein